MHYQAIIFDMDGTIIDTEHIWKKATADLLISRGIAIDEVPQSLQERLNGLALHESCFIIKTVFNLPDELSVLIQEKSTRAVTLYQQEVRFVKGFIDFHTKAVSAYRLKTGIATNANDETVAVTNKVLNLSQYFGSHIYPISCVDNKGKPDPAIYLHVAKQLGTDPKHCIAIEDSAHGVQSAKKAGMYCIGINTSKSKIQLQEAHSIVEGYEEINLENVLSVKNH